MISSEMLTTLHSHDQTVWVGELTDSMGPYGILINRGQTNGLNGLLLGNSGSIASPLGAGWLQQ